MKLNVIERGPDAEAEPKPPVVLLHGLFGRARNLGYFQRRLAADRRTLAVDLRNHGDSPHGQMDYTAMAFDLVETLAAHDALPATIVGHSMGGKAAMTLALNRPELVSGLLVADIPPARTGHGSFGLGEEMLKLHFPRPLTRAAAEAILAETIASADVRGLMMQNLRLGEDPGWSIGLSDIVASMSNIEGWPYVPEGFRYEGPTVFLAGETSPYIRPGDHEVIRRLFPRYRFEVIERAGHWLHVENPARFLFLLQDFLREA